MTYEEIVQKIKSLEIQGAEKIAVKAVEAFAIKLKEAKDPKRLLAVYEELKNLRSTEPGLRNALKYCLAHYETNPKVADEVVQFFENAKQKIAEFGSKKIQDGMNIFTHCHSSTVEAIMLEAKKQGKNFTLYSTETRPRFQGRITAENMAKAGIPVIHFVDSAAETFLKKADLFLFGCDAITAEGKIYNKIGTAAIAEFAALNHIPVYSCTNSWKFDPETLEGNEIVIEERDSKEVWENPPPGVTIKNPAFEITSPGVITGVITELGIFKPETLVLEVQKAYPWMGMNNSSL